MRVALTIDTELAGHVADPLNARRLLDVLAAHQTLAAFFVTGRWAGAHPDLARRIAADGHLIGNHTYHHAPLPMMTDEGIRHTVRRAEELILRTTDMDPRPWFRCPYGAGERDSRVLGVLGEIGYRNVPWEVSCGDWVDDQGPHEVTSAPASYFIAGPTRQRLRYRSLSAACGRQAFGWSGSTSSESAEAATVFI